MATTRGWSSLTSEPLLTRTSRRDRLDLCEMPIWSILFSVMWLGDIRVALWTGLCGNRLSVAADYKVGMGTKDCKMLTV